MSDVVPRAQPGSQSGATRASALSLAAAMLATSALAAFGAAAVSRPPQAPNCPPQATKPGDWLPDDRDGCWERHGDRRYFRTTYGGTHFYSWEPPATSRYYGTGHVGG